MDISSPFLNSLVYTCVKRFPLVHLGTSNPVSCGHFFTGMPWSLPTRYHLSLSLVKKPNDRPMAPRNREFGSMLWWIMLWPIRSPVFSCVHLWISKSWCQQLVSKHIFCILWIIFLSLHKSLEIVYFLIERIVSWQHKLIGNVIPLVFNLQLNFHSINL